MKSFSKFFVWKFFRDFFFEIYFEIFLYLFFEILFDFFRCQSLKMSFFGVILGCKFEEGSKWTVSIVSNSESGR